MKKCRHPHVVKLLEVIDDKLKSKIYLSEHFSLIPSQSLSNFLELTDFSPNSHGVSRWRRNSLERRTQQSYTAGRPDAADLQGCHPGARIS